jgi:hypothetical protein
MSSVIPIAAMHCSVNLRMSADVYPQRADLVRDGRRLRVDEADGEARVERSGDGGGRDADDEAPRQHQAVARVQRRHGDDGAGVGRHQPVHHRHARQQRQRQAQERLLGLVGQRQQDGQQQHEADREPRRQADGERKHHDAPRDPLGAKGGGEPLGQHLGTARLGKELAQHRPQADDGGDAAQHAAQPLGERLHDRYGRVGDQPSGRVLDQPSHADRR